MAETASSRTNLSLVVTDSWLDLTVMATYSFLYEITGVQASGSMAGCARTHLPQETPGVDAGALPWRAALSNCTPPPGHQHLWNQRTVQVSGGKGRLGWLLPCGLGQTSHSPCLSFLGDELGPCLPPEWL